MKHHKSEETPRDRSGRSPKPSKGQPKERWDWERQRFYRFVDRVHQTMRTSYNRKDL